MRPFSRDSRDSLDFLEILENPPANPSKFAPTCTRRPKRQKQICTNLRSHALVCELRAGTTYINLYPSWKTPQRRTYSWCGVQIRVGLELADFCLNQTSLKSSRLGLCPPPSRQRERGSEIQREREREERREKWLCFLLSCAKCEGIPSTFYASFDSCFRPPLLPLPALGKGALTGRGLLLK